MWNTDKVKTKISTYGAFIIVYRMRLIIVYRMRVILGERRVVKYW